jgi:hypothetical protein
MFKPIPMLRWLPAFLAVPSFLFAQAPTVTAVVNSLSADPTLSPVEEGGLATPAAMAVFSTFIRAKTPSFPLKRRDGENHRLDTFGCGRGDLLEFVYARQNKLI